MRAARMASLGMRWLECARVATARAPLVMDRRKQNCCEPLVSRTEPASFTLPYSFAVTSLYAVLSTSIRRPSNCTTCSWLTPFFWQGSCYSRCPRGSYNDGGTCLPCKASCAACSDANTCTACHRSSNKPHLVAGDCVCRAGFRQSLDACVEINECTENSHDCFNAASCVNTAGGFLCVCPTGFSGDGRSCTDINECAVVAGGLPNPCDPRATCTNSYGGFSCACTTPGFTGNGFVCGDADECALGTHKCHANARCLNREAGYDCTCKKGFRAASDTCENCHGGFRCDDIDECAEGTNMCHATRAECVNQPGFYRCACLALYMGDGIVCTDRPPSMPPQPPGLPPRLPPPAAPPPSPSPPGTWTEYSFDAWPGGGETLVSIDPSQNNKIGAPLPPDTVGPVPNISFPGTNGWWGWPNAAQVTRCGELGEMLGGAGVFGKGAYIEKVLYNLPMHTGLRIEADWFKIDYWGGRYGGRQLKVLIDGGEAFASDTYTSQGTWSLCGNTRWRQGDFKSHFDVTSNHVASTARIRITSTLDESGGNLGSWGINNIRVTLVMPHPSPPAPPSAPGQWNSTVSDAWNIGSQFPEGWHGVPSPNPTSNCGEAGTIVGGFEKFGKGAFLERTFTDMPAHWGLRVQLDFILIDHWGRENAQIFIDGAVAWSSNRRNANDWITLGEGYGWDHPCGGRKWQQHDVTSHVDMTTYHFKDSATIRITTEAKDFQWWGVQNFRLETMVPHPSPPAPPFMPGVWEAPLGLYSREIFPGRNEGWHGVPSANVTTTCGELGTFLGGHEVFGVGAYVEKTFVNLPNHDGIRVQATFLKWVAFDHSPSLSASQCCAARHNPLSCY
jgi:hypothetical protein